MVRISTAIGTLALAALSSAGQGYSVEKVPGNGYSVGSSASYLGNNGYVISNTGVYHDGVTTTMPLYNGNAVSAGAVNGSGQVVGTYQTGFTAYGTMTDSVRVSGNAATPLGAGGTSNQVAYIGDDGTILGSSFTYPNGVTKADGWVLRNGVQTYLQSLGNGGAIGAAMNASGVIVGAANYYNGSYYYHATRWVNGVVQDLGTGGTFYKQSQAVGIDRAGDILIAASQDIYNDGATSMFFWKNGTLTQLPTFSGASTRSTSMNALGQVAGQSQDASGNWHSFLWDSVHGMTELDNLADGTSFTNVLIGKINDQGQLLGNAYERQADGGTAVWAVLLTPQTVPEPGTWAALGLGAATLVRRRRRD